MKVWNSRRVRLGIKIFVALILCALFASSEAADVNIWQQLRHGGYVILMRHTAIDDYSTSTDPDADFDACMSQRNLSPQGQAEAARIGKVLRARRVPIGEVLAGPACRTRDTARIAFKSAQVWEDLDLLSDFSETVAAEHTAAVNEKIGRYAGKKNWVLVTHQPNIDALIFDLVEPGTLVVLKPDGQGFKVVGKLHPK